MMAAEEYQHPKSGRIYRKGDPAHTYALACHAAWDAARLLGEALDGQHGRDYLTQAAAHPYQSLARMRGALEWVEKAYTAVIVDRDFSDHDEEWERKYG